MDIFVKTQLLFLEFILNGCLYLKSKKKQYVQFGNKRYRNRHYYC